VKITFLNDWESHSGRGVEEHLRTIVNATKAFAYLGHVVTYATRPHLVDADTDFTFMHNLHDIRRYAHAVPNAVVHLFGYQGNDLHEGGLLSPARTALRSVDRILVDSRTLQILLLRNGIEAEIVPKAVDTSVFYPQDGRMKREGHLITTIQDGYRQSRHQDVTYLMQPGAMRRPWSNTHPYTTQADKARILRAHRIFVYMPKQATLPMDVLEAMASGLPLIVSSCGDLRYMTDGIGICMSNDMLHQLQMGAVPHAVEQMKESYSDFKVEALARVEEQYSLEAVGRRYEEALGIVAEDASESEETPAE
jgi:hypothetical protein